MATLYEERKKGRRDASDAVYLKELSPPEKGRKLVFDGHRDAPRGFGIRINAGGTLAFVLRYNAEGRDRLLTIGEYPTWSLTGARAQANTYRQQIDTGQDILESRRAERAELTVTDAVERFIQGKAKLASANDIAGTLRNHLVPEIGKKKLRDVRRRDVIAVVERFAESRPRQAGKLLTYTKQLFSWAEDRELIETSPIATLRAQKFGKGLSARKRERVLSAAEIAAFWNNVEISGMRHLTALALKFILLTGQRPGEVAGLHEDEIDGSTWTISSQRRGKTESAHTVPLTDTAQEILQAARAEVERLSRRRKAKPFGYIFEVRAGSPLVPGGMSQAVARHVEVLSNQPEPAWGYWRPHDLRRTMRTGLAAAGVSETVAELVIGHMRQGIAAVYDLHRYDAEKRAALEAWERRLLRIAAGASATDATIVSIAGGKT